METSIKEYQKQYIYALFSRHSLFCMLFCSYRPTPPLFVYINQLQCTLSFTTSLIIMSLQCKVCGKEFPEFDQRGFRNAGFTAHQNRCIGRATAATTSNQNVPVSKPSPPRRRLLPATTTTMASMPTTSMRTDYWQQQQQQHLNYSSFYSSPPHPIMMASSPPCPPPSQHQQHYLYPATSGFVMQHYQPMTTTPTTVAPSPPPPTMPVSSSIDFSPVYQCDFCVPQHGYHSPTCSLLQVIMDMVNQQGCSYASSSSQPF